MLRRIDGARQAVALAAVAGNLNTPCRHFFAERGGRLEIDGVPPKLDERLTAIISVRTCDVRTPVAPWIRRGSPDASFLRRLSGRVDVKATRVSVLIG